MEKVVRVFDSAAEADAADALAYAQLSPDERLRIVIELRDRMPLSKDLREFLALLNSNKVEYLEGGGFAVARCTTPLQAHE